LSKTRVAAVKVQQEQVKDFSATSSNLRALCFLLSLISTRTLRRNAIQNQTPNEIKILYATTTLLCPSRFLPLIL